MRSILLTWDIEEFDAPEDFGAPRQPDGGLARGAEIWQEWIGITQNWNAKGTIFITARLAQAFPDYLQRAKSLGHEIASHGWTHKKEADLRLKDSREKLTHLAGSPVHGFLPQASPRADFRYFRGGISVRCVFQSCLCSGEVLSVEGKAPASSGGESMGGSRLGFAADPLASFLGQLSPASPPPIPNRLPDGHGYGRPSLPLLSPLGAKRPYGARVSPMASEAVQSRTN